MEEVTPEMIAAVNAHQQSERERDAAEFTAQWKYRQEQKMRRLRTGALAQARTVVAELTEEGFAVLADIFSEYLHELEDW